MTASTADRLSEQLALALLLVLREGSSVAACRLRVLEAQVELQEAGAERLDLLLTAERTSKADTMAPSRRAVAIACSPATPAPSTSTSPVARCRRPS